MAYFLLARRSFSLKTSLKDSASIKTSKQLICKMLCQETLHVLLALMLLPGTKRGHSKLHKTGFIQGFERYTRATSHHFVGIQKNATKANHKKTTKNTFGIAGADQREAGRDLFFRVLTTREKQSTPDIVFLKQSSVIHYLNHDQNLFL